MIKRTAMVLAVVTMTGCHGKDELHRRQEIEAVIRLNEIAKYFKEYFVNNAGYPAGSAPLAPSASCCTQPNHLCTPIAAEWSAKAWKVLDYQILDQTRFQYSYESDGKTFTAKAVADLDCDGHPTTFVLHGTTEQGVGANTMPKVGMPEKIH